MLRIILSTILIITAIALFTPAIAHVQDTSVAQLTKTGVGKSVKNGRIEVDGMEYYYQIRGQGKPLLLLHGGLRSVDMFAPIMSALAAKDGLNNALREVHG